MRERPRGLYKHTFSVGRKCDGAEGSSQQMLWLCEMSVSTGSLEIREGVGGAYSGMVERQTINCAMTKYFSKVVLYPHTHTFPPSNNTLAAGALFSSGTSLKLD